MSKLDITSTAIEKSIELVKGFLEKISGAAIEEIGFMWADNIKLRRFKNQIRIFEKAQKIAKDNNLDTKKLSLRTLVPLIEYSSLEEDESLQEKWINLIVNFVDANKNYESSIFPFILSQLSTIDIEVLNNFNENGSVDDNETVCDITSFSNLIRLGLLEVQLINDDIYVSGFIQQHKRYSITHIGSEFIKCCSRSNNDG